MDPAPTARSPDGRGNGGDGRGSAEIEPAAERGGAVHADRQEVGDAAQREPQPIPAGLEEIVMQLIEKDPADRIQSAAELARRLRAIRHLAPWCPDRAEQWWEMNQPNFAALREGTDTATLPGRLSPDYAHT